MQVCGLTTLGGPDPPSLVIVSHGSGGNMKAALCIWSAISSSSLNGKVPLRLHTETESSHNNRMKGGAQEQKVNITV